MTADGNFDPAMGTIDPRSVIILSLFRMLIPRNILKRESSPNMPSEKSDYGADASHNFPPLHGASQGPLNPTPNVTLNSASFDQPAQICTSPNTHSVESPVLEPCVRYISMKELAAANTDRLAWVAVRGSVYDLTKFFKRHPGGTTILRAAFGKDVTGVFETSHDDSAIKVLKKYYIGNLIDHELPRFPEPSEFSKTLRLRVKEYFAATGQDPKIAPWMYLRYSIILTTSLLLYYLCFYEATIQSSTVLQTITASALGISLAYICMYFQHDGSHCSFTHKPWVWDAMCTTYNVTMGLSSVSWMYQHVLGHHPYTNINGADPDISTADNDWRRIKGSQKWRSKYLQQYIYAPLVYCFLATRTRIVDFNILYLKKAQDHIRVNPMTMGQHAMYFGSKFSYLATRFILPYALTTLSFANIVALNTCTDFVMSWMLALIFQANHVVSEVEWPLPNAEGMMEKDWAQLQVETAQDYCHDSWLVTVLTGGLNYQVVHHLFPHISQYHSPALGPIIREVCKEYNVRYIVRDSFWEALGGHIGLLKWLGSGEPAFGHAPHEHDE